MTYFLSERTSRNWELRMTKLMTVMVHVYKGSIDNTKLLGARLSLSISGKFMCGHGFPTLSTQIPS